MRALIYWHASCPFKRLSQPHKLTDHDHPWRGVTVSQAQGTKEVLHEAHKNAIIQVTQHMTRTRLTLVSRHSERAFPAGKLSRNICSAKRTILMEKTQHRQAVNIIKHKQKQLTRNGEAMAERAGGVPGPLSAIYHENGESSSELTLPSKRRKTDGPESWKPGQKPMRKTRAYLGKPLCSKTRKAKATSL